MVDQNRHGLACGPDHVRADEIGPAQACAGAKAAHGREASQKQPRLNGTSEALDGWASRKDPTMSDEAADRKTSDEKALKLAEQTDVSPKQAKDLMRKHGKDSPKVEKEAKNFKAEG
jgi:hypothetical protein